MQPATDFDRFDVMCDPQYDFNAQIWQTMPKTDFKLMPTDVLEQVCEYDTSAQTETTAFGEASNKEMCVSGIKFYPKLPDFSTSASSGGGAGFGTATSILTDQKHMGAMIWKYKDYDREPDHKVSDCGGCCCCCCCCWWWCSWWWLRLMQEELQSQTQMQLQLTNHHVQ